MKILLYILTTILYGAKVLLSGVGVICAIFLFFIVLIMPPMASFQSFVDGDTLYGIGWLIITLFIYGHGFKDV